SAAGDEASFGRGEEGAHQPEFFADGADQRGAVICSRAGNELGGCRFLEPRLWPGLRAHGEHESGVVRMLAATGRGELLHREGNWPRAWPRCAKPSAVWRSGGGDWAGGDSDGNFADVAAARRGPDARSRVVAGNCGALLATCAKAFQPGVEGIVRVHAGDVEEGRGRWAKVSGVVGSRTIRGGHKRPRGSRVVGVQPQLGRANRVSDGDTGVIVAQPIFCMGENLAAGVLGAGCFPLFASGSGKLAAGSEWLLGEFWRGGSIAAPAGGVVADRVCRVSVFSRDEKTEITRGRAGLSDCLHRWRHGVADALALAGKHQGRVVGGD